jgi:hypothetical protein
MKKHYVLFLAAATSVSAMAQPTLTSANVNGIGTSQVYYVADSNAVTYDAITGAGVTWDYSTIGGYNMTTNTNSILDISSTAFAADYPSATMADELGTIYSFTNYFPDTLVSYGYSFYEVTAGTVLVKFTTDTLYMMTYPFTYGDSYSDNIAGTAETAFGTFPFTGTVTVNADGHGTLLVAGNTHSNVLRVKISENSTIQAGIPFGNIDLTRVQYYYYDPAASNFPIFAHSTVAALGAGQTIVLTTDMLMDNVGVQEEAVAAVNVWPNPVAAELQFTSDSPVYQVVITDNTGRMVVNEKLNRATSGTLSLETLVAGMYQVSIRSQAGEVVRQIVKD